MSNLCFHVKLVCMLINILFLIFYATYFNLISIHTAYQSIFELGKLGIAQFEDMNPSLNANKREFIGEIKRCDEMQRRLRYFRSQLVRYNLKTQHEPELKQFNFSDLEAELEERDQAIQTHTSKLESISLQENEIIEIKHVIKIGSSLREDVPKLEDEEPLVAQGYAPINSDLFSVKLGTVTGVIPSSKVETLQRMCYVLSRGNIFVRTLPVPEKTLDPATVCYSN